MTLLYHTPSAPKLCVHTKCVHTLARRNLQTFSEEASMIKILLVDDQPRVRRGLRMRLALEADIMIVGEAAGGQQALEAAARLQPDVVVMDVEMPDMDGIEAAKALHDRQPEILVIMLSIHDTSTLRARAQAAGAAAYVEKSDGVITLLNEIRQTIPRQGEG